MRDLHCWYRFKELTKPPLTTERKDRYRTIYMRKILDKLVPHPTPSALQPYTTERTALKYGKRSLPTTAPHKIKTMFAATLAHEGPKIFYSLP